MMTKERNLAINLIYSWAQEHTSKYTLTVAGQSDKDIDLVASNLSFVIMNDGVRVDLLSLIDRVELLLRNKLVQSRSTGCMCIKCKQWYDMAIPNQPDDTLICYSCRTP